MASLAQDITIFKNRYHVLQFTVDGVSDLVSFVAYWTVSTAAGSSAIITKSSSGGTPKITISGLNVTVVIDETDFSAQTAGTYYHELVLVDELSKVNQGAIGELELLASNAYT